MCFRRTSRVTSTAVASTRPRGSTRWCPLSGCRRSSTRGRETPSGSTSFPTPTRVWIHPEDAKRIGVDLGDLIRITTDIGYFVNKVWVTEGMRPGVVACSHHLGRWRLFEDVGTDRWASALVSKRRRRRERSASAGSPTFALCEFRPDSRARVVDRWRCAPEPHLPGAPDPISGMHCWHQAFASSGPARETVRRCRG
jgi:hypothetical protein